MADFNHTDYTEELNRIISALTGMRDDLRLIRRRTEDSAGGVVTNQVLNDFQTAMLAISMSGAGASDAESVRQGITSGTGLTGGSGDVAAPSGEDTESRAGILSALGQPADAGNEDPRTIYRVDGLYYIEAKATAGPDDGLRGSIPQSTPYIADGGPIGYHRLSNNTPTPGAVGGPPDQLPDFGASKKRWVAPRPEDRTALPNADPNSDIVNPVTGGVAAKSLDEIVNDIRAGGDSPPPAPFVVTSQDQAFGIFQNPDATPAQTKAAQDYVANNQENI